LEEFTRGKRGRGFHRAKKISGSQTARAGGKAEPGPGMAVVLGVFVVGPSVPKEQEENMPTKKWNSPLIHESLEHASMEKGEGAWGKN